MLFNDFFAQMRKTLHLLKNIRFCQWDQDRKIAQGFEVKCKFCTKHYHPSVQLKLTIRQFDMASPSQELLKFEEGLSNAACFDSLVDVVGGSNKNRIACTTFIPEGP